MCYNTHMEIINLDSHDKYIIPERGLSKNAFEFYRLERNPNVDEKSFESHGVNVRDAKEELEEKGYVINPNEGVLIISLEEEKRLLDKLRVELDAKIEGWKHTS